MHGLLRAGYCLLALSLPCALSAASVYRCTDTQGHTHFSDQACPPGQAQQTLAPRVNSIPPPQEKAKPPAHQRNLVNGSPTPSAACGRPLNSQEKRTALIRRQVLSGMTRQDIESAFGKPDRITSRNNQTRYEYRDTQGNTRQVVFDEAGCVKARP